MPTDLLYDKLKQYTKTDYYPFHMPGHKRLNNNWDNLFSMDITEIDGFDDYHHPEEVIKYEMELAASIYHSDKSYYLINGSTGGILSAISAVTNIGDEILVARNCHKSVYNAIILRNLKPTYVYPQDTNEMGISSGISYKAVDEILYSNRKIKAVVIVSPTYEGVVSNVYKIAEVTHKYGIPLIVDEAHGAHFNFSSKFPTSAVQLGADIVVQSLHKTLPSYTQTAILHWNKRLVDNKKLEENLSIYQSSSPSYIFLSTIGKCIAYMDKDANMDSYISKLTQVRKSLSTLSTFYLFGEQENNDFCIYEYDKAKIVLGNKYLSGKELYEVFKNKYHLQMEMCTPSYVIAMTSVCDIDEGYARLVQACKEIENNILTDIEKRKCKNLSWKHNIIYNTSVMTPYEANICKKEIVELNKAEGYICGEMAYVYPPGIPFIVPGEQLSRSCIQLMNAYKNAGFEIRGLKDSSLKTIMVINK